jgi:hypothetical protein
VELADGSAVFSFLGEVYLLCGAAGDQVIWGMVWVKAEKQVVNKSLWKYLYKSDFFPFRSIFGLMRSDIYATDVFLFQGSIQSNDTFYQQAKKLLPHF